MWFSGGGVGFGVVYYYYYYWEYYRYYYYCCFVFKLNTSVTLELSHNCKGCLILLVCFAGAISCDNIRERFGLDIRLVNMRWNICNLRENSQEDVDKLLEELSLLMLKQRKRSHSLNSTEKNSFNSTEN